MKKLWGGRFEKDPDALTEEMNSSIHYDIRLFREDITGSIAHAHMLAKQGIISQEDVDKIVPALRDIMEDIAENRISFTKETEDIHMSVETELTRRIGDAGKRLHTARSRNDQVALDFRIYLKREIAEIREMVLALLGTLCEISKPETCTIMPAYTHLQRAQPTTFAHYMMAYANMLRRDVTRFEDCYYRMDEMPLGSGALCATTHPIDRAAVAGELGFRAITENSIDGVSDRDYAIEFLAAASLLMMHLSRFSEEIILWCSWEFGFIALDDAFSTGSSIMPQKKNPDIAEIVRGKTGRVYGALMTLLSVMKSLPLAYNKDMQEDKEQVFDTVDTVKLCLPVFTAMIKTMNLRREKMRAAAAGGFINATDCADYLTKKGVPFRDAYTYVGGAVHYCIENGMTLETLSLDEYRAISDVFDADVYDAIKLENCVAGRSVPGGPAPEEVKKQIASIEKFLSERA